MTLMGKRQAIQPSRGPWVPDLRSPGSSPGSLVRDTQPLCPGRVQRARLRERNEAPISGLPEIGT
jgi:hypothetical protein